MRGSGVRPAASHHFTSLGSRAARKAQRSAENPSPFDFAANPFSDPAGHHSMSRPPASRNRSFSACRAVMVSAAAIELN